MDDQPVMREPKQFTREIDDYFSSIADSFESSLAADQSQDFVGNLLIIFVISTAFSVLPIIPVIVWGTIRLWFSGWELFLSSWRIPTYSFLFWWLAFVTLTLPVAAALSKIDDRHSKRKAKDNLGLASMRFALCYAIVHEIDRFAKNRLSKHIERATDYWVQFGPLLTQMLNPLSDGRGHQSMEFTFLNSPDLDEEASTKLIASGFIPTSGFVRYRSMFPQIDMLRQKHTWFKLDTTSARILNAFNSLPLKITGRLKDKKDLTSVAAILTNVAAYLYTTIPEISSTELHGAAEITNLGEQSLIRFTDELEALSVYDPEPRPLDSKQKVKSKFAIAVAWIAGLFSHENLLAKFSAWLVLSLALVIVALSTAWHYDPGLKLDSTLISLIVATPLVVSAAALASPLRRK